MNDTEFSRRLNEITANCNQQDKHNRKLGNVINNVADFVLLRHIAESPDDFNELIEQVSDRVKPIGLALLGMAPFNTPNDEIETARYLWAQGGHKERLEPFINNPITEGS